VLKFPVFFISCDKKYLGFSPREKVKKPQIFVIFLRKFMVPLRKNWASVWARQLKRWWTAEINNMAGSLRFFSLNTFSDPGLQPFSFGRPK
jgi:hypothetical protein